MNICCERYFKPSRDEYLEIKKWSLLLFMLQLS